ncbi:MAG: hypothetical protein R6T96_01410, partial [Longimicrobiales bacterium]
LGAEILLNPVLMDVVACRTSHDCNIGLASGPKRGVFLTCHGPNATPVTEGWRGWRSDRGM